MVAYLDEGVEKCLKLKVICRMLKIIQQKLN